jgi:hypothetical protein
MYRIYAYRVEGEGGLSDPFEIKAGVRQGCLLCLILFLMALDIIMKAVVTKDTRGRERYPMEACNKLEDLDYAGYICLLAPTLQAMKGKLQDSAEESKAPGLRINIEKTKEIRVNATNKERFCVYNGQVEEVGHFCYLGSQVTKDGGAEEVVDSRIKKVKGTFAQLTSMWRSRV